MFVKGKLPQHSFLPSHLTVKQVIALCFKKKEAAVVLDDIILKNVLATQVSHLSGGEGRYLEIKMLLYSNAAFVLLDEPFNRISPVLANVVKEMIRQQSAHKGILLTDHDFQSVLDVSNKYLLLFDGGLKEVHNTSDLIAWGYLPVSKQ